MSDNPEPEKCAVCGESADWRFYLVWLAHPYDPHTDTLDFSALNEYEGEAIKIVYLCEEHMPCLDTEQPVGV